MANDDEKGDFKSETNPPVKSRKEIIKNQKEQGQNNDPRFGTSLDINTPPPPPTTQKEEIATDEKQGQEKQIDPKFKEAEVKTPIENNNTPPPPPTPKEITAAKKEQGADKSKDLNKESKKDQSTKVDVSKYPEKEKFNNDLKEMKEKLNAPQKDKKSELTEEQKNAINFINSVTPIDQTTSPSTLQNLRDEIKRNAALLPPGQRDIASTLLATVGTFLNQLETNLHLEHDKELKPDELDPKEIQEKTDRLNGLWNEFKSDKFQNDFKKYADKDAASLAEIDRLLADPSSITEEDRRRLSGDYLTPAEIEARDREIEERRHQRNIITGINDNASDLAHHHGSKAEQTAREIESLRKKGERSEELEAKNKHHEAEQKKHLEKLKEVAEAHKAKEKDFQKLEERAAKNPENSELLKNDIFKHYHIHKDEYHKEIASHKNPVEAAIVILLTSAGMHKDLAAIEKDMKVNLKPAVKEAKKEEGKQKERCGDGLPGNNPTPPPIQPHMPPPPAITAKKVAESNNITAPNTPSVIKKTHKKREI